MRKTFLYKKSKLLKSQFLKLEFLQDNLYSSTWDPQHTTYLAELTIQAFFEDLICLKIFQNKVQNYFCKGRINFI